MTTMQEKPFSQACENNKEAIGSVLAPRLGQCRHLLEIGSGTGQHAVYLAPQLSHLIWQTSDLPENHPGIRLWLQDFPSDNLRHPLSLDVTQPEWPLSRTDAVFTANTFHIMAWDQVLALLDGCGALLNAGGLLLVYGPFNEQGEYTSESNARFDEWLKETAPHRAIRDRQQTAAEAWLRGLELRETLEMPANNRILVFERGGLNTRNAVRGTQNAERSMRNAERWLKGHSTLSVQRSAFPVPTSMKIPGLEIQALQFIA